MQIEVEYAAQLKRAAGRGSESIELADGSTLHDLVQQVAGRHGAELVRMLLDGSGSLQPSILMFIGDEQVRGDLNHKLRDRDVVTLLSPISGG